MEKLIRIKTALPDVEAVYKFEGNTKPLQYLWMERGDVICGPSMVGRAYWDSHKEESWKEIGTQSSSAALEDKARSAVTEVFKDVLILGDELDLGEVSSIITLEKMQELEQKTPNRQDTLWFAERVKKHMIANKTVLDGLINIIFEAPSVIKLFNSSYGPAVGMSLDLLAAVVSDSEEASHIIYQESLQLLKDPTLMAGIYAAYLVYDLVIRERNNPSWWGNMAIGIINAFEGKSSIRMYVKEMKDPVKLDNLGEALCNIPVFFTEKGLSLDGSWWKYRFGVLYRNHLLKDTSKLSYENIVRLEYKKKIVWENPAL